MTGLEKRSSEFGGCDVICWLGLGGKLEVLNGGFSIALSKQQIAHRVIGAEIIGILLQALLDDGKLQFGTLIAFGNG